MNSIIKNEQDLKEQADSFNLFFSQSKTNDDIFTELLRRQLIGLKLPSKVPPIQTTPITNTMGIPEIQWEAMSCYLDAILQILIQKHPSMDRLLWETLTHKTHPQASLCNDKVEVVRETWRQTIFHLFQTRKVSLRPFLTTLKDCEDIISPTTPFWTSCLNDPLEFLQNVFIPVLMISPKKSLYGKFRERKTYIVADGHAEVEPATIGDSKISQNIELQVLNMAADEVKQLLSSRNGYYMSEDDFTGEIVFKTKETWEYNSDKQIFIQNKGQEDEKEVKLEDRTDDIGSQIMEIHTTTTPIHPKANIIFMGVQTKTSFSDVPMIWKIDTTERKLIGAILFDKGHYTSLFHNGASWIFYDSMKSPEVLEEKKATKLLESQVRAFVFAGL